MSRALAALTLLTTLASIAPRSASGQLAPPRRPFLFKDNRGVFVAFVTVSLSGFGGVLAWTRRMIVERRRWMTPEEFNAAYSLCNFLPGPNIVNFSVVFGSRIAGPWGAVVALAGLLGPPVTLVLVFGALYAQFGQVDAVRRVLGGVAPAAAGLMIATAAKMAAPLFRQGISPAPFVIIAMIVMIGILRWPLPVVVLGSLPVSIALVWWLNR